MGPPMNKRRLKRGNDEAEAYAPPKVLRKDHVAFRPAQIFQKYGPRDPYRKCCYRGVQDLLSTESPGSGKSTSILSVDGSPGSIYQSGWGVTNNYRLDTPDA
ncbi:hypothetical protein Tco_0780814, partial [Tanacetum coccineum]